MEHSLRAIFGDLCVYGDDFIFVVRFDDILKFWIFNFAQKKLYSILDYV
jgi:hypothetical protein